MKSQKTPISSAEITKEVLEGWKKEYPSGVFLIVVEDKKGYIRKPNRKELKGTLMSTSQNDALGIAEGIMKATWLGGDVEILNDDEYFYPAAMQLQEIMTIKSAKISRI